jgi:polysaccharide biosynthesis/export protein
MTKLWLRMLCAALVFSAVMAGMPGELQAQDKQAEVTEGLESLSLEERAALLEMLGQAPLDDGSSQRDTSSPQIMLPRSAEGAAEVLPELAAEEVDSLLVEEEIEDGPIHAFRDFLEQDGPPEVELLPFGYDLFRDVPSTFAPATDIPVSAGYLIGPGDELHIRLYGKDKAAANPVVDRDGLIDFPELGPISVAGLTFGELRENMKKEVEDRLIGTEVSITMGRLRSIQVFILGDVALPGNYLLSGLTTMSHALFTSGGVGEIGSLRRIQLKRGGQLVGELDLYDMLLSGDSSGDLRLQPMDVLFVPPVGPRVGIRGQVKRPAIYEIDPQQSVEELIALAGGLLPSAHLDRALIERVEKGSRTALDFSLKTSADTKLQDGDLVRIFAVPEREENVVFLEGNVLHPGMRSHREGMRLSDLISSSDELLPESYFEYGLIEREDALSREPGYLSFDLGAVLSAKVAADLTLEPRDRVFVFHRGHFREIPKVIVMGEVRSPGEYRFQEGMRALDLILAAGGLTHDAWTGRAELLRTEPASKEVLGRSLNLDSVLNGNFAENVPLMDLDTLKVHSIWEIKQRPYVEVIGEVNNRGRYPLFDGMRVSDLIFAGGNVTERAYLNKAELTRFTVVDGERRELWRLDISLRDALAGELGEDIQLQPYDNLLIQRLSNWRNAERVRVTGEVAFPGTYPIEEGERLSDLIERFGGFLADAYLPAAVFTRTSVRDVQEAQFQRMAEQLEGDLARLSMADPGSDAQEIAKKKAALEAGQSLVTALRDAQALGRLVIKLADVAKLRGSEFDMLLQHDDHLYVPKLNEFVMVMGQVHSPMAFKYRSDWDASKYINQAGGETRFADGKATYVVRADGSVTHKRDHLQPGDVIVVPQTMDRFDAMEFAMDMSQVLYQVGLAAAAAHSVGLFN